MKKVQQPTFVLSYDTQQLSGNPLAEYDLSLQEILRVKAGVQLSILAQIHILSPAFFSSSWIFGGNLLKKGLTFK